MPNELKLRDEGALKTFTLFLLGFILMAGLQALEAYLDIWFLYQTGTFHAKIIINTCVTTRRFKILVSVIFTMWRWLGWKFIIIFGWAFVTVTTLVSHWIIKKSFYHWPREKMISIHLWFSVSNLQNIKNNKTVYFHGGQFYWSMIDRQSVK